MDDVDLAAYWSKRRGRPCACCPSCGRPIMLNLDGSLRKHKRMRVIRTNGPAMVPCDYTDEPEKGGGA